MHFEKALVDESVVRVVEGQSYISTRQLVDSDVEQEMLEQLIDDSKPPYPANGDVGRLGYLLKTPFRYPPLKYGSRFGSKSEMGIFYGSLAIEVALCESAYSRFKFMVDSDAVFEPGVIKYTSFEVAVESGVGLNLTAGTWEKQKERISSKVSYQYSQSIGQQAKKQQIDVILYYSARTDGVNVAVLDMQVFKGKQVKQRRDWDVYVDSGVVEFSKGAGNVRYTYSLQQFLVDGVFPVPE